MKTYQFVIPAHVGTDQMNFLESLSKEFGGLTVGSKLGFWTPSGALDTVDIEDVAQVQVTTDERDLLLGRVVAYMRTLGEKTLYFGLIGDHEVIYLDDDITTKALKAGDFKSAFGV